MGSEGRLRVYQEAVSHFGLACYIKGAVTSLFFLAHEFHDNFEAGVLTNTNCGGKLLKILLLNMFPLKGMSNSLVLVTVRLILYKYRYMYYNNLAMFFKTLCT